MKDGWHTVKIKTYGLSGDANRDKARFAIAFDSVDTPGDGINFYGGFKSPAAQDFTEKVLGRCDWNGDYEQPKLNTDILYRILVETETYNEKTSQKVKAIVKASSGFKAMDEGAKKSFASSLKRGAPAPAAANSRSGGGDDFAPNYDDGGDIPFLSQADTTRDRLR